MGPLGRCGRRRQRRRDHGPRWRRAPRPQGHAARHRRGRDRADRRDLVCSAQFVLDPALPNYIAGPVERGRQTRDAVRLPLRSPGGARARQPRRAGRRSAEQFPVRRRAVAVRRPGLRQPASRRRGARGRDPDPDRLDRAGRPGDEAARQPHRRRRAVQARRRGGTLRPVGDEGRRRPGARGRERARDAPDRDAGQPRLVHGQQHRRGARPVVAQGLPPGAGRPAQEGGPARLSNRGSGPPVGSSSSPATSTPGASSTSRCASRGTRRLRSHRRDQQHRGRDARRRRLRGREGRRRPRHDSTSAKSCPTSTSASCRSCRRGRGRRSTRRWPTRATPSPPASTSQTCSRADGTGGNGPWASAFA